MAAMSKWRNTLLIERHRKNGSVPVRDQYLEPPLFFALEGFLIGIKLFGESFFAARISGHGGVFEHYSHAIIPATFFGRVIARSLGADFEYAPALDLLFEHRIMVLLEQANEFVGVSPFRFVVILDDKGLILRFSLAGLRNGSRKQNAARQ